jgi:hypothetical protein
LAAQQGLPADIKNELIRLGMGHIRSVMIQNPPAIPDIPISDDAVKCPICLGELETCRAGFKNVIFTPCGHPFHPHCIGRIKNNECPVCRSSLSEAELQDRVRLSAEAEEERDNLDNFNAVWDNADAAPHL